MGEKLRALLPTLILSSVVLSLVLFPLGYVGSYDTVENVPPFSLSNNYSNLGAGENHNLQSGQWQANNASLTLRANNMINPNDWAFLSVISTVDFPMVAGTTLYFSGSFGGLDMNASAVRVSLILTHSSDTITLYYLVGNPSIPPNQGNYRYYFLPIQPVNGAFLAQRDIMRDLSDLGTKADSNWEIRSVAYGFAIYPPSFNVRFPVEVRFDSDNTGLNYSGFNARSNYFGAYSLPYYGLPFLLLLVTTGLQVFEMTLRKPLSSVSSRPRLEEVPT